MSCPWQLKNECIQTMVVQSEQLNGWAATVCVGQPEIECLFMEKKKLETTGK